MLTCIRVKAQLRQTMSTLVIKKNSPFVANVKIRASRSFPQDPILRSLHDTRVEQVNFDHTFLFFDTKIHRVGKRTIYYNIMKKNNNIHHTRKTRRNHNTSTLYPANTTTRTAGKKVLHNRALCSCAIRWAAGAVTTNGFAV